MSKILAVSVHPDDETLGCGGTLLKHNEKGDKIFWLILTRANDKVTSIPNIVNLQKQYVNKVAATYNFEDFKQLSFLTTELDRYPLGEIIREISNYIDQIEPSVIYFNHCNDVHSDHRVAFDAIYSCTKSFRYPFITKILMYETLSETEFAPALPCASFIPNVYVDITDYLDQKIEIMKLYETELMEEPYPRSISSIEALARFRGSRAGVKYAEAFMLLYEKI
jgi:LmbE family N-acetylglucosaminyl deacetylase